MPDTLTVETPTTQASVTPVAPERPARPRKPKMLNALTPTALVLRIHNVAWEAANLIHHRRHEETTKPSQALKDAMGSLIDETLPDSVVLAKALLPVIGDYTVADAVYIVGMLRAVGFDMQSDRGIDSENG